MTCRAKHAPLVNLRSCDRSIQSRSPSCADGCLAGDVYLAPCRWCVVLCTWILSQVGVCGSLPARILYSQY